MPVGEGAANFKREFAALSTPNQPYDLIIGVDEAGRGPLAGPVVAGAFCFFARSKAKESTLPEGWPWNRIGDSKAIAEGEREYLFDAFLSIAGGKPVDAPPDVRRLKKGQKQPEGERDAGAEAESESEETSLAAAANTEYSCTDADNNLSEAPIESKRSRKAKAKGRPRGVRPPRKDKTKMSDTEASQKSRGRVKEAKTEVPIDGQTGLSKTEPSVKQEITTSEPLSVIHEEADSTALTTDPPDEGPGPKTEAAPDNQSRPSKESEPDKELQPESLGVGFDSEYDCDISEYAESRRNSVVDAMMDDVESRDSSTTKDVKGASSATASTKDESAVEDASAGVESTESAVGPITSSTETLVSEADLISKMLAPRYFVDDCPILFAYSTASPEEIDRVNILEATMRCMTRAVYKVLVMALPRLGKVRDSKIKVFVDGNRKPHLMEPGMLLSPSVPVILNEGEGGVTPEEWQGSVLNFMRYISNTPVVKGDRLVASISAASIVAKVVRDRIMRTLDRQYPQYMLSINKGYPTPEHQAIVKRIGPSEIHRLSFTPIFQLLQDKKFPCPIGRDFEEILTIKAARTKKRPPAKTAGAPKKAPRKARAV